MEYGIALASNVDAWKTVKRAEELGFSHAWFYDTQLLAPDVFIAMALAAEHTSKIKLGTGVVIPSNRIAPVAADAFLRPVQPENQVRLLDQRFREEARVAEDEEQVVQRGGVRFEVADERRRRLAQVALEIVQRLVGIGHLREQRREARPHAGRQKLFHQAQVRLGAGRMGEGNGGESGIHRRANSVPPERRCAGVRCGWRRRAARSGCATKSISVKLGRLPVPSGKRLQPCSAVPPVAQPLLAALFSANPVPHWDLNAECGARVEIPRAFRGR